MGISKNEFEAKIPDKFTQTNFYTVKIPWYKDANLSDEYKKHDYVFEYKTENELSELLQSILTENTNKNIPVEDKDVDIKEQPNENVNAVYPDYYAGKYIDNNEYYFVKIMNQIEKKFANF